MSLPATVHQKTFGETKVDGHIDLIIRYATAGAASETPFQISDGGVGGG